MKKEYEHIEDDISILEEKVKKLENEKILCGADYQKLIDINNEQDKLNKEIEDKILRWEYLEEQYQLYNKERRK
jgi:ATP-binding cassette subfamily F protein uup